MLALVVLFALLYLYTEYRVGYRSSESARLYLALFALSALLFALEYSIRGR